MMLVRQGASIRAPAKRRLKNGQVYTIELEGEVAHAMTPEEVKKRFEKAIESMFASASRHSRAHQDSWATSKTRLLMSLTRCILWVRQWKESLSTTALSGPSLNCWKSSKMLKKVALVMVLVMAALVLISIVVLMASLL